MAEMDVLIFKFVENPSHNLNVLSFCGFGLDDLNLHFLAIKRLFYIARTILFVQVRYAEF